MLGITNKTTKTEATPAEAITRTLTVYSVIVLISAGLGGQPTVRELKVQAHAKTEATQLANQLLRTLDNDDVTCITAECGGYFDDSMVLWVDSLGRSEATPGHVWTCAEIESDDLEALVQEAAKHLEYENEQPPEQKG